MATALTSLLHTRCLTEVVDIGANPIDGDPPYLSFLAAEICRGTGFEPQEQPLAELQQKKGQNERYLPDAIGDGNSHILNLCRISGMTSLFDPNPARLTYLNRSDTGVKLFNRRRCKLEDSTTAQKSSIWIFSRLIFRAASWRCLKAELIS